MPLSFQSELTTHLNWEVRQNIPGSELKLVNKNCYTLSLIYAS